MEGPGPGEAAHSTSSSSPSLSFIGVLMFNVNYLWLSSPPLSLVTWWRRPPACHASFQAVPLLTLRLRWGPPPLLWSFSVISATSLVAAILWKKQKLIDWGFSLCPCNYLGTCMHMMPLPYTCLFFVYVYVDRPLGIRVLMRLFIPQRLLICTILSSVQ